MVWYLSRSDRVICDGPCATSKVPGFAPCPVDHAAQPFNDVDTDDGTPLFCCPECELVLPLLPRQYRAKTDGMVPCPECQNGERLDTFDGPCEWGCKKRGVGAAFRKFPDDVADWLRRSRRFAMLDMWACPKCWHKESTKVLAEFAHAKEATEHRRVHGHKRTSTCTVCGEFDYLDVFDVDNQLFVCVRCHPAWAAEHATQTADQPEAGWYPDPDNPGEYLRYWSGTAWEGPPTRAEHVLSE